MKVLFLDTPPAFTHGLSYGFQDLGHEILHIHSLQDSSHIRALIAFIPDLVIMIGWGKEHTLTEFKRIQTLLKPLKIPLIYWATEDPAYTTQCTLPLIQNVHPDFVFTICQRKLDFFHSIGVKAAYLDFGYHPSVHYHSPSPDYDVSIAVVANTYIPYLISHPDCIRNTSLKILIEPLLSHHIRIDFWGNGWEQMAPLLHFTIPNEWLHGYLEYTDTYKVYSSAKIVIGLQNKQVAMRTFEILGSSGFLLTTATPYVSQLFKNKQDLILSSSAEETLNLVSYYLNHPQERTIISEHGHQAVLPYHYKYKAGYIIETLIDQGMLSPNKLKRGD